MTRILIVDDDRNLLRVLVRALEQPGWEVVGVKSIAAARAAGDAWDAVVADVGLPNGDGRVLRAVWPDVPFLLISGAPVDEPDEVRLNTVPFLPKPFSVGQLRAAVQRLLPERAP